MGFDTEGDTSAATEGAEAPEAEPGDVPTTDLPDEVRDGDASAGDAEEEA